jgi:hypothetical protein
LNSPNLSSFIVGIISYIGVQCIEHTHYIHLMTDDSNKGTSLFHLDSSDSNNGKSSIGNNTLGRNELAVHSESCNDISSSKLDDDMMVHPDREWNQKDTIERSRRELPPPPPPPPPPPQSDRFFKPLSSHSANSDVEEVTESNVVLGRRDVVTPPVGATATTTTQNSTTTTTGSATNSVSTPQLSPSLIGSLRGISSPSNSQISVGSNPMLLNAVLSKKHFDLTPVTRNTSMDMYCDTTKNPNTSDGNLDSSIMTITPSSQQDTDSYLHGEHLAFPSDLSRATFASGPAMPPLQPVVQRRSSKQNISSDSSNIPSSLQNDNNMIVNDDTATFLHMDSIHGFYPNDLDVPTEPAVQFPSRKYYSFTTREQYEEACRYDPDSDDDLFIGSDDSDDESNLQKKRATHPPRGIFPRTGMTPYAPQSRPANFDIEQVPEEELKRIFISRGSSRDPNNNGVNLASSYDSSGEHFSNSETTTNLNFSNIPLGPIRIPSIHMANHLHNDSTTSISYTDQEDEDSIIVRIARNDSTGTNGNGSVTTNENDDASLSSYGSNINLQAMEQEQDDNFVTATKIHLRKQRKRKQRKKEEQDKAMEWLQSVEANPENDIAEAASSKFFTASSTTIPSPYYYHHSGTKHRNPVTMNAVPMQRQMSVPANITSSFTPSSATTIPTNTASKILKNPESS